ncbi:MAG: hypothetical protein H8F28_17800 [Fibrella sp.]|nr:hypothetical protein [Armatimonadota bacterium]
MTESLLALLFLLLATGVCYGIGRWLVRLKDPLERFVFAVPLGMGVLSLVLLVLGVCRLFIAPVFYGIFALGLPGLFFLWRDIAGRPPAPNSGGTGSNTEASRSTGRRSAPPELGDGAQSGRLIDLGFNALFVVLAVCTLIAALAPPGGLEWDALSYHLTVPKAYLREARIFYVPYDHHSNFPFLLQMLYTLMLGVKSVGGAKLCHWLCGVLLVLSVYTFARRQHSGANGKRVGQIAALLVAASPIVLWEAGIAYVDLATALFTWLSVYALLGDRGPGIGDSAGGDGKPSDAVSPSLSPILMGFAIGTKWTVLGFWGITLAGIVIADLVQSRRVSAELVKRVVFWAGVSLLLALPWLLRSYLYTGNPVYPYFYNLFGGRFWSVENAAQYSSDQGTLGAGKDPMFLLLVPWLMNHPHTPGSSRDLVDAVKFNEYGLAFTFALIPLLLAAPFKPGKWGKTSVVLAIFALLGYVFWFFLVQGSRYFLPILPVVALLAAESLMGLWNAKKGFARYVGAGVVAASGVWGMYLAANMFAVPAIRVVLGAQSRPEYVASTQWMGTLLPASEWINANTPPGSKVALFDVVFGFYIDRPILWANPNHSGTLLPWEDYRNADEWLADFKRRGYTYLLTDDTTTSFIRSDSSAMNQAWRTYLPEAVASGKVEVVFEKADERGRAARVYRIL